MPRIPIRELASRILLVALSSAISLGAAELLFRWYTGRTFDRKFPPWTGNLVVVRGAQVFAFKPHASGVFPGNVDQKRTFPYRTNAHGLRDRDRPAKAPGTKRVLVIGDSYTWGYAIAEEEAYPQVAERLLAERGRPDIEVINGGIPDYNSRQERQLLEQLMPIYQPDAVFLAYVVNDAEPSTAMPTPPEEVYRHSRSWFLTEVAERLNRRVFRRRAAAIRQRQRRQRLPGWLRGRLGEVARLARGDPRDARPVCRRGKPFTILMMPDFTQAFDERYALRRSTTPSRVGAAN